jgi:hypothetical protein
VRLIAIELRQLSKRFLVAVVGVNAVSDLYIVGITRFFGAGLSLCNRASYVAIGIN